MFCSSRQSYYGSRWGRKWDRGFSKHRVRFPSSKRKSVEWSPTVINTWGSPGVITVGICVGTPRQLQSWWSWESNPWVLRLWVQTLLQCGPLQTRHGAGGGFGCLRAIPLEVSLLSIVIASPSFFTWIPPGILLRLFKNSSDSHYKGFH